MPNCDFYAVREDLIEVLEFIFAELPCRVFEAYSPFDTHLVEFKTVKEVDGRYPLGPAVTERGSAAHLKLFPVHAGGSFTIHTINLRPAVCKGATFRETIAGSGFISLLFGGTRDGRIVGSWTNHNSAKRALGTPFPEGVAEAKEWDFSEVTRVSSQLNRFIRKRSEWKIQAAVVMPEAARKILSGQMKAARPFEDWPLAPTRTGAGAAGPLERGARARRGSRRA